MFEDHRCEHVEFEAPLLTHACSHLVVDNFAEPPAAREKVGELEGQATQLFERLPPVDFRSRPARDSTLRWSKLGWAFR